MKTLRTLATLCLALGIASSAFGQAPAQAKKKKVLVIGQVKGFQHDSVSQALATIWNMGRETGLYDTYLRTDAQLVTKKKLTGNAKNLDFFDAVVFYTTGELDMDDSQKADLLSFVKDDGKGFVGVHSATDTFYKWPEYGDMIGGYFDGHPWNTFKAPVVVEDQNSPITRHFPKEFVLLDEIYQARNYSRDKVRVLMTLDASKLDLTSEKTAPKIKRADKDFAVTWIREYGKGRVFYSTLGHTPEAWDNKDVQKMYLEAIKYALGITKADATPRPKP
jgi:hypothetical protein